MTFSPDTTPQAQALPDDGRATVVLVREAGVPYQPPSGKDSMADPIAEWLSLMQVVQMLCPTWPVRDKSMQGDNWKL